MRDIDKISFDESAYELVQELIRRLREHGDVASYGLQRMKSGRVSCGLLIMALLWAGKGGSACSHLFNRAKLALRLFDQTDWSMAAN